MSDKSSSHGNWESHSSSSQTVKIGNNPATVTGHEAAATGTFDVSQFVCDQYSVLLLSVSLAWKTSCD